MASSSRTVNFRMLASAAAGAALLLATLPAGAHAFDPKKDRETHLLSRSYTGGFPNGASRNAVFAQNGQGTSFVAFESDASDIVPNDVNGFTDVFLVRRGGHFTQSRGEPWQPAGGAQIVSSGMGGQPANGPSYDPQADGDAKHRQPHCVAFVSQATNLVPNDTNGKADAFVKDLRSGRITRVSVGRGGVQSDGDTFDVSIDGSCTRVAFTSNASNLYLSKAAAGKNRFLNAVFTQAPLPGTKQVYVRFLNGQKDNRNLAGVTFLASASNSKVPGARDSYDVSFGRLGDGCPKRCGTSAGDSVAFTSDASNLAGRDSNGVADVYQRTFYLPTLNYKQRRKHMRRYLRPRTLLISATRSGQAGNGPSTSPASNDDGEYVVFQTDATNLVPGDHNNASDVLMRGTFSDSKWMRMVSHAKETGQANAASYDPTITSPASIIFFSSDASNLQPNKPGGRGDKFYDRNCMRDVFFWNTVSGNASLQSRDSLQRIPNLPENVGASTEAKCPPVVASGSSNPSSSYYGNYFLFESAYPLLDLDFESYVQNNIEGVIASPIAKWELAAKASDDDPSLHQVYLRYNGPKDGNARFPRSSWPKAAS
ncbi:MAG: TolB protein [Thermoleophilaceae bacterium]|nr:TolB protein [Thermoleophilaceae bacterium]